MYSNWLALKSGSICDEIFRTLEQVPNNWTIAPITFDSELLFLCNPTQKRPPNFESFSWSLFFLIFRIIESFHIWKLNIQSVGCILKISCHAIESQLGAIILNKMIRWTELRRMSRIEIISNNNIYSAYVRIDSGQSLTDGTLQFE